MRKILLGTTAVVGAALLAPEMAAAQQAPTVRIGGYFRAYYGYTQQTSPHVTGNVGGTVGANGVITGGTNVFQAQQTGDTGISGVTSFNTTGPTAGQPSIAAQSFPNNGTSASAA